jgi:hypothetical protein
VEIKNNNKNPEFHVAGIIINYGAIRLQKELEYWI